MSDSLFAVDWDQCIGAGGEGEVFLGRCIDTWELCAIKVSTCLDRDAAATQLRTELMRCLRAAGDGVVGLMGWNLDGPRPFLAFELATAGTLADELSAMREQRRVYHPVQALRRAREVLVALSHVHERGLVHRDVKPGNLLRFGDGMKLTDFGTGRTIDRPRSPHTERFVGTRMYAPPEQRRGQRVDERGDLYAVGCILFEMLTGRMPPAERERPDLGRYPNALVLPDVERLLDQLLDPRPARRPADAADAIRRIDRVLGRYATARAVWEGLQLGASPY